MIGLRAVTEYRLRNYATPYFLACRFFVRDGPLPSVTWLAQASHGDRTANVAASAHEALSDWDLRPLLGLYTRLYFDFDSDRIERTVRFVSSEVQAPVWATWPSMPGRGLICDAPGLALRPANDDDGQGFIALIIGWPEGFLDAPEGVDLRRAITAPTAYRNTLLQRPSLHG